MKILLFLSLIFVPLLAEECKWHFKPTDSGKCVSCDHKANYSKENGCTCKNPLARKFVANDKVDGKNYEVVDCY